MIDYEIIKDGILLENNSCDLLVFEKIIGRFALMSFSIRKSNDCMEFYVEDKEKPLGNLAYEENIYNVKWTKGVK